MTTTNLSLDRPQTNVSFFTHSQPDYAEQLAIELETYAQLEESTFAPVLRQQEGWQAIMALACEERQQVKNLIRQMRAGEAN